MKSKLGLLVLALSALAALPAHAADRNMVRAAQMRLADLGYFSGFDDGVLGPVTKSAIRDFQRRNNLAATGQLNLHTYDLLVSLDEAKHHRLVMAGGMMNEPGPARTMNPAPETWHYVGSQKIPVRYGDLQVDEEAVGNTHRYTIKLNGRPFLLADNQPGELRISDVFHLSGEDAVLITAWRGEEGCKFKNYLVAVHANGAAPARHEFESCSPSNDVHEAHGALFIRFAAAMNQDGFDRWDVWRYENDELVRL